MSFYSPALMGDTTAFRAEVERLLTTDDVGMSEYINQQDEACTALGKTATFGVELEFTMADNPDAPAGEKICDNSSDNSLYAEIIREVDEASGGTDSTVNGFFKGEIINPWDFPDPIMASKRYGGYLSANNDQIDSGIIEIRTAPATAIEAIDRYWRTLQAIGTVAARHNRMALPLALHMNAALFSKPENDFIVFRGKRGGDILASVQHNLIAMNPLQLDAGIEEGVTVLEAFGMSKDSSTAVHEQRLEIRHPVVGVIDPRVDVLAVLNAVQQWAQEEIPAAALNLVHPCSKVSDFRCGVDGIEYFIQEETLWDRQSHRLAMPAIRTHGAHFEGDNYDWDTATDELLGTANNDGSAHNALFLRQFLADLRYDRMTASLPPDSQFFDTVGSAIQNVPIGTSGMTLRTVPHYIDDSPQSHRVRRGNMLRSATVRRILGTTSQTVRPADEAIAARQHLFNKTMIVLPAED